MMISPEAFYEFNLKDKNEKQIMTVIRSLKMQIGHLKKVMEHPDYGKTAIICPSEDVQISCLRQYIERAKVALSDIVAEYIPTKSELKELEFQENLKYLSLIVFDYIEVNAFRTFTLEFKENEILMTSTKYGEQDKHRVLNKDDFIAELEQLNIREWHRYYDSRKYGIDTKKENSWGVFFEYNNGKRRVSISGNNAYPYNYSKFMDLFVIEE